MPTTITNRLRVCVTLLRDLFESSDRFENFRLVAPFTIDTLTLHLLEIRKVQATCFDAFNKMNVIADLPSVEMDGRTSLSVHEATYSILEKAHARLTTTFARFGELESAERQRLLGEAIQQVLESLKTLPQFAWSELDAELRKEEIRVQEFTAKSIQHGDSNHKESSGATPFRILADYNAAISKAAEEVTKPLRMYSEAIGNGKNGTAYCVRCSKLKSDYDYDRSECHDCRSPQGKLADLEAAIKCEHLYGNESDSPERIREWPTIRAYLRDKFGPDRTNMQLWEWMTDHLRVLGWGDERWLRMRYSEFIELLKSGLLNERQPENKSGSAVQSSAKVPLYDDDVHIGMVDLSELTKLCTSLLRQDKRQGTLYRDEAGRFIYHVWDFDDKTIGRTCRLMRPADAYELALKADQFFVGSDELIAELAELKRRDERTTESDGCLAVGSSTAETAKEPIEALGALSDKKRIDALIESFKEETKGFNDNQWSDKVDRRTKAKAKEGRGRKTRSFYFEGVGGIYYGDDRTYVIRGDDRLGYYSLAATHSERIGKKFATEFSLNRR